MKSKMKWMMVVVSAAVIGGLLMASCRPQDEQNPAGLGERTGAAIDRAAGKTADKAESISDKTVEATKTTIEATKDFAGAAVEKTGEVLEKAGTAVEKTGENMQE